MSLLSEFLVIAQDWRSVFPQQRTLQRGVRQALSSLVSHERGWPFRCMVCCTIQRSEIGILMQRQILAVALAFEVVAVAPQSARAQATEPKTAEQVYKNITQLKGTPADQLMPAMQFIAFSLGVECTFCHVQGKMDLDDKPAKKTAREMMAMTAAINKNSFGGQRQITCYSCHHGLSHPANVPPVLESDAPARIEAAAHRAGRRHRDSG